MIKIDCLRKTITSGHRTYPVFVGFATASDLLAIGDVPAFRHDTSHSDISSNVLTPPVKEWQRPLAPDRVKQISSVFNNSGELMPNPVLLCQNLNAGAPPINIVQQKASGSIPTDIWQLNIPIAHQPGPKSLWILDGQHRINGLAQSAQSNNPMPAVFLLNEGLAAYSASQMAKLFAQVTTAAAPLDELHHEWLTFSFDLEHYDPSTNGPAVHANKNAMVAVAELCRLPAFGEHNNPFWNQIKFNSPLPAKPPLGVALILRS